MKKNILLIHGWDYLLYTNMTKSSDAWGNYKKLIAALEEKYNVYKINLPGFCSAAEPKEKQWNIEDFSNYINSYLTSNNIKIDLILGYSFGGAVALDYKYRYKSKEKLFLVAPAIIRNFDNSKKFISTPKIVEPLRDILRDIYVIYIVKNNEMKYGTKFLRNTYQNIVREDKRELLEKLNPKDICIVYGSNDTAVDPNKMLKTIDKKYLDSIKIIDNADHDNIIVDYVNKLKLILNKFD